MWSSSLFIGSFVGPTVSGLTVEHFGFPLTTSVFVILFLIMLVVNVGEFVYTYKVSHSKYNLIR